MKLKTTISDFMEYTSSWEDAVRQFEGTGFRYLDFSFYTVLFNPDTSFLGEHWMKEVEAAANAASKLGFTFVQAHSPSYNPYNHEIDHECGRLALLRSIEACSYLGISNLVMHPGFSFDYRFPADKKTYFEVTRRYIETLYPYMEKYNVSILIENIDQGCNMIMVRRTSLHRPELGW